MDRNQPSGALRKSETHNDGNALATGFQFLKTLDANKYATKKTIAQGLLDVALLTANASQLKYVLQVGKQHEFYTLMLSLIIVSIVLQVVVGIFSLSCTLLRDCRLHMKEYHYSANMLNYLTTGCALLITILNLLISVFDPSVARYAVFEAPDLVVAILFVIIGGLNINKTRDHTAAIVLNDVILIFVFIISLVNIIISGFGLEYSNQPLRLINEHSTDPDVSAALLAVVMAVLKLHEDERQALIANILNHVALGLVTGALFCDAIQAIFCVLLGSTLDINKEEDCNNANRANNSVLILNLLIVGVNVLVNAFQIKYDDDTASNS